jgi:AraC-like DNA-binding protein
MLYAVVMTMALMASAYLLFRRGNAFAEDIIPPLRLRRWAAVFFGIMAAGHLWYLPGAMVDDSQAATLWMLIGGMLDCLLTVPVALVVMLCMLQDRRRPLWPVWLAMVPLVIMMGVNIANRSDALLPWMQGYFLLAVIGFTVYMVREVRRYGRWLRDNYADLEHKEVWQSFVAMASILLMFGYYVSGDSGMAYEYIIQVCGIALVCFLLWRVETLSSLNSLTPRSAEGRLQGKNPSIPSEARPPVAFPTGEGSEYHTADDVTAPLASWRGDGGEAVAPKPLLQQHCIDTQLYLQRDLTINQLAQALGTNRTYLSQYFSSLDTTYNAYINKLRIDHFCRLYQEEMAANHYPTAQQLFSRCGYRSYSTFSLAFKQRMGQSVASWMRNTANNI